MTLDKALQNIIVSAYAHYIDSWLMNGACLGHCAILMRSMLQFAMHYGRYRCRYHYNITQCRRKGIPTLTPMPAIDLAALLDDKEENLRPQQINVMQGSVMEAAQVRQKILRCLDMRVLDGDLVVPTCL